MKRMYRLVSNRVGNAILLVTGLDVLTGSSLFSAVGESNENDRQNIAIAGVCFLIARRILQKFIDLNTVDKSKTDNNEIK